MSIDTGMLTGGFAVSEMAVWSVAEPMFKERTNDSFEIASASEHLERERANPSHSPGVTNTW